MLLRILITVSLLGGCAYIQTGQGVGADAADKLLTETIYTLCKPQTIGAIKRRFNTTEKMELYNKFCLEFDRDD